MHDLPTSGIALCALVFLLGLKHGFDADHLAMINGLTRCNGAARRPFARWCGALFSLGHGAVVLAVVLAVQLPGRLAPGASRWAAPQWLETAGAWTSIALLLALGTLNLRAALAAAPGAMVSPIGLRSRWLGRLAGAGHPLAVAGVGALFAISLDTIGQALLFALAGADSGSGALAPALAALFTLGMLATDAVNGLWVSRLLERADAAAAAASRWMALAIGGVSVLAAGLGAARLLWPAMPAWNAGAAVVAAMLASHAMALLLARRASRTPAPA